MEHLSYPAGHGEVRELPCAASKTSRKNQQTKERKNELLATNKAELQLLSENKKNPKNKRNVNKRRAAAACNYLLYPPPWSINETEESERERAIKTKQKQLYNQDKRSQLRRLCNPNKRKERGRNKGTIIDTLLFLCGEDCSS
jgi:hypothetical protein